MRHNNGHFFKIIPQPSVVRKPNDLEEKKYQQINKFISDSLSEQISQNDNDWVKTFIVLILLSRTNNKGLRTYFKVIDDVKSSVHQGTF